MPALRQNWSWYGDPPFRELSRPSFSRIKAAGVLQLNGAQSLW